MIEDAPESEDFKVTVIGPHPETQTIESVEEAGLIHLPGEDDTELRQLINDILTAKNTAPVSALQLPAQDQEPVPTSTILKQPGITEITETDLFKNESALYLKIIEDALANLQEQPHNLTFLEDIELSAYSIKRLAQKMGFDVLSRLPEQIEINMADLAKKQKKVSRDTIINISDAIRFLNNLEENDVTVKDKLKNILNKLNMRDKQLIY